MLKVERKVFEEVVVQIVKSTDIKKLRKEFSKHRVDSVFFYSLLKDISKGKDSPNYHVLETVARDKKIDEQFIVERARSIVPYFAPEDYYKILNVSYTASAEEIRKSWLNLMKTSHPDRVGDQGLDITEKLNEAYEVLRDPKKRSKYDATRLPILPIVVVLKKPWWIGVASRKFIYSALLGVVIFTVIFYLAQSGSPFRSAEEQGEFIEEIEEKSEVPIRDSAPATNEPSPLKLQTEEKNVLVVPWTKQKEVAKNEVEEIKERKLENREIMTLEQIFFYQLDDSFK